MPYATPEQYAAYVDPEPSPDNIGNLLRDASLMLDSRVLRYAVYDVDEDGAPTDPLVTAAFADAVCAQVEMWDELGDTTGLLGAGWNSVSAGTVSLSRSSAGTSVRDSPQQQLAPKVMDHLTAPALACRLRLGWVW